MISRRLIRIKVFKTIFAYVGSESANSENARKELDKSFEKTKELYYFLLNISGSLVNIAQEKIEAGLRKFHPSESEANPNMKFVNNRFAALVSEDPEFGKFCQKKGLVWAEYDVFVKKVFASVAASDYYNEYMNSGKDSFEEDCELFKHIFEEEFEDNDMLDDILEDMSMYWIDDVAYVLNVIIKNIDTTKRRKEIVHPQLFATEDDREFAEKLLDEGIAHYEEYRDEVNANVTNWDSDRLVSTDITLIVLGLAEAVAFSSIPVKVTINEYVEISKYYSTPNSRIFVKRFAGQADTAENWLTVLS